MELDVKLGGVIIIILCILTSIISIIAFFSTFYFIISLGFIVFLTLYLFSYLKFLKMNIAVNKLISTSIIMNTIFLVIFLILALGSIIFYPICFIQTDTICRIDFSKLAQVVLFFNIFMTLSFILFLMGFYSVIKNNSLNISYNDLNLNLSKT